MVAVFADRAGRADVEALRAPGDSRAAVRADAFAVLRELRLFEFADEGDEFPADTVLVLRVEIGDAGYVDPAGNPVPETNLTGTGAAMIFHDGRLVRGTWKKDGLDAPITLSAKSGDLTIPAGHVWIELVPADNGAVTFGT